MFDDGEHYMLVMLAKLRPLGKYTVDGRARPHYYFRTAKSRPRFATDSSKTGETTPQKSISRPVKYPRLTAKPI